MIAWGTHKSTRTRHTTRRLRGHGNEQQAKRAAPGVRRGWTAVGERAERVQANRARLDRGLKTHRAGGAPQGARGAKE
eukprot:5231805-Prymnesium_polylepis.1